MHEDRAHDQGVAPRGRALAGCRPAGRARADHGGAARGPPGARRARPEEGRPRRRLDLRQSDAVRAARGPRRATRATRRATSRSSQAPAPTSSGHRRSARCIRRASRRASSRRRRAGARRRLPPASFRRRRDRVLQALLGGDAGRGRVRREGLPAALRRPPDGARSRPAARSSPRCRRCARGTASRCRRATPTSRRRSARSRRRCIGRSARLAAEVAGGGSVARATADARRALAAGVSRRSTTSRCAMPRRSALTLPGRPGRVLAAAWLGKTRLIDNVAV